MEINLADSLKNDAGWELYNFGYNGPNPPYVRIGTKIIFAPLGVEPCFESFITDKIWRRSKVSLAKHLRAYDWIKIKPITFEETYGRKFATDDTFPFNQWLRMGRSDFIDIQVLNADRFPVAALPLLALSVSAGVDLKRDN